MASPSPPRPVVSVGDSIVIYRESSRKWRSALVAAADGEGACEVVYEDGGKEWVALDEVKYMLRRGAGRRKRGRGSVDAVEEEDENGCTVMGHKFYSLLRKSVDSRNTSDHILNDGSIKASNSMPGKESKSRSIRLKDDLNSCTEKESGSTELAGCRRSRRLQQKLTSASPLSAAYFVDTEFPEPTRSLDHRWPNRSKTELTFASEKPYLTSESSDVEGSDFGSSEPCLFGSRRSLRLQNKVCKFSEGLKQNMERSAECCQPHKDKFGFCGIEELKTIERSNVHKCMNKDADLDEECCADFCDALCCSICQIREAGHFLVRCSGVGCCRSFHTFCLLLPLKVRKNGWLCPYCKNEPCTATSNGSETTPKRIQRIVGHRRICKEDGTQHEDQFLIKWDTLSHLHDSWVPQGWLYVMYRSQLFTYLKNNQILEEAAEIDHRKPEWFYIDRVIACRRKGCDVYSIDIFNTSGFNKLNGDYEFLVKWVGLDYCDVTWESSWTDELFVEVDRFIQRHVRAAQRTEGHFDRSRNYHFVESPDYLSGGILYDYQLEGLNWILKSFAEQRNVILADEMGLGKTIQVVSFVQCMKQENLSGHPVLIIAPKSILFHWEKEFRKWAPCVNAVIYHGDKLSRRHIKIHEFYSNERKILFDVIVTNYEMILVDDSIFRNVRWSAVIIDEGHKIKSLQCKLVRRLKDYTADFRLLLTGTPLQNTLLELFSLLHFLDPEEFSDPLAEAEAFSMIGKERVHEEALKIAELHDILKSRMLRRMKSDVLPDSIPPKKWVEVPCSLTDPQKELYINILEKNYQKLNEGIRGGKKVVLNHILMQLRKCCNHPYLFPGQEQCSQSEEAMLNSLVTSSGKLQLLEKILPKLKARGNRVLLFSQMTTMLDILEDFLVFLGLTYFRIDGSTSVSVRQHQMKEFNDPECKVFAFLISTRAGGLGIDLPTADRVIIYDPDFNPFMDLQAQSRAHRIGQTKPVVVYQLITKHTVEEKILAKSKEKLAVENLVMNRKSKLGADELHSVLLHGARTILSKNYVHAEKIHYDDETLERLLNIEPALGKKYSSEDNGYLGSIQSFGHGDDEQPSASATVRDWEAVLGPVKVKVAATTDKNLGRGKRERKQVRYECDDSDDDEVYSPESSSASASSEGSDQEEYWEESER